MFRKSFVLLLISLLSIFTIMIVKLNGWSDWNVLGCVMVLIWCLYYACKDISSRKSSFGNMADMLDDLLSGLNESDDRSNNYNGYDSND